MTEQSWTYENEVKRLLVMGLGWFPTSPGGNERYVYELTHQLAAYGDDIELCAVGLPENDADPELTLTNLCEADWSMLKRLNATAQAFSQRQFAQMDAINLHFPLYSLPILPQCPKEVPVTFTFHGPWASESQREGAGRFSVVLKRWMEKWVYARCDRFIVLSHAFGDILHQDYEIPWKNIHIVPGGVDLQRFRPSMGLTKARERLEWPQNRFILFTPRRLVHRMGLEKLIDAVAQLVQKFPQLLVAIAGKGPLRENLEQQVQNLGLSQHVQFLGFLPDDQLPIAYEAANLTVIPSQALEGFGLILLESLACGTPVTCTPVGGMPEVVQPFTPELVMDSIETEAIAEKLSAVLSENLSLPSSNQCRDYVVRHYDWCQIAQRVRQVLIQPIGQR